MKKTKIPLNPAWVVRADFEQDGLEFGCTGTLGLFRSCPDITALFVMGERVAIGVKHALHQLGMAIPDRVSLIACDDAPEAAYLNPPLTVMRIPNRKLGYSAARWVHQMIMGDAADEIPREPWMRGELIIRDSTAPPCTGPVGP